MIRIQVDVKIEDRVIPRAIFLFRGISDLDYSMPLIFLSDRPIVFVYNPVDVYDKRILILKKNGVDLHLIKVSWWEAVKSFMGSILAQNEWKAWSLRGLRMLDEIIEKNHDVKYFILDHSNDKQKIEIVRRIRGKVKRSNVISVPHGGNNFLNKMNDYRDIVLSDKKDDYSMYDLLICNDERHWSNMHSGRMLLIPPLRYSMKWSDYLLRWDSFAKPRFEKGVGRYLLTSRKEYEYITDAVSEKFGEESAKYVPLTFLHSFIAGRPASFSEMADWSIAVRELLDGGVLEHKEYVSLSGSRLEDVVEERYLRAHPECLRYCSDSLKNKIEFKEKVRKQYIGIPLVSFCEVDGKEKALSFLARYKKAFWSD